MKLNFDQRLIEIKEARQRKLKGDFNSIPFGVKPLDVFYPGLVKGSYYCITANSGAGKTQTGKWLLAQQPYQFIKRKNPNTKYKMIWFALEEDRSQFVDSLLLNHMHREIGSFSSMNNINAYGEFDVLTDEQLRFLESDVSRDYYEAYTKMVDIVDYNNDWRFIIKYIYRYAMKNGRFMKDGEKVNVTLKDVNNMLEGIDFDSYIPNDPEEYLVIVIDHISLISGESRLYDSMAKLSNALRVTVSKLFKYIPVVIQQQAKEQGANIERFKFGRMLPDANNLADNKALQNDYLEILGVFQPAASQLETFSTQNYEFPISGPKGYGNRLSFLIPLKSRYGGGAKPLPMIFYGECFMYYSFPFNIEGKDFLSEGPDRDNFIKLVRDKKYIGEQSLANM